MPDRVRYGYFLHPSRYDPPLGYGGIDVYLARSDANRYFDAMAAFFSVTDGEKTFQVEAFHPFPQALQRYQAVFGRFHLLAYDGDRVEGMCLGGVLEIETASDLTLCRLSSPAPIFDMEESRGLVSTLEVEVEAELARLRAEWKDSDAAFDRRLASQDPLILFSASLTLLQDYLHNHPQAIHPDAVLAERTAVHQAIRTLQRAGQWPQPVPTLRQLMLQAWQGQPIGV